MTTRIRTMIILLVASLPAFGSPLLSAGAETEGTAFRRYSVDAALFSFQPGVGIGSFRSYGRGSASGNSTLGHVVAENERRFSVMIRARLKSHHFLATVNVKSNTGDTRTQAQEHEYDLSDIRPRTLDIARDDDGRVYRLNLVPHVIEAPEPKPFRLNELRLENWSFPASTVILNDQDYIGRLGMSSGALAWIDVPGLAKIEFSLLHLKNANSWGILKDGIIDITHENGTSLRISNVKNGIHRQVLEGGPYQVWVRWNKSTQSVDEYRRSIKAQIATIRKRLKNGDLSLPPGSLQRLEKLSETDRIMLMSNGLRGVKPDEIVNPK